MNGAGLSSTLLAIEEVSNPKASFYSFYGFFNVSRRNSGMPIKLGLSLDIRVFREIQD